jgi:hypothetical protein
MLPEGLNQDGLPKGLLVQPILHCEWYPIHAELSTSLFSMLRPISGHMVVCLMEGAELVMLL